MLLLQYHNKAFNTLELDRAGKSVDQAFHMEKPNNNLRQKMSHYVRKILSFSESDALIIWSPRRRLPTTI